MGTDEFWVQVAIHVSELKWVQFPEEGQSGAETRVILDMGDGESAAWKGRVIRLLSDLDPLGRMARLLVSVTDPLQLRRSSTKQIALASGQLCPSENRCREFGGYTEDPASCLAGRKTDLGRG